MTPRDIGRERGSQQDQHAIGAGAARIPAATGGIMQCGEQEHGPEDRHTDALEHAERTRLETERTLGVERVGQHREADSEPGEVGTAPSREERRDHGPLLSFRARSTSSIRMWRTSLPCTM